MRMRTSLALLFAVAACGPRGLTPEQYATQWAGVMAEYQRTTETLPEPAIEKDWPPERKRTAVADALVAAGAEMDRVAKQQDALRPPKTFAKIHQLSSTFFHDEADLFRQYAEAVRKDESTDPVRQRFNEHKKQVDQIHAEAVTLGLDLATLLPGSH